MCPSYYEMIRSPNPNFQLRYRMVMAAEQIGIRAAARLFGCSRNTVRKWLRRFRAEGKAGLQDRSRAPKRIPHKTPPELERAVLAARDRIPCFGPKRLKREFGLRASTGAIGRILKQNGRVRKHKKPRPRPRSLAAEKMGWRPWGRLQVDVKDLSDLPGYRELIPYGLPRYQFTARVVPEGAIWLAFSRVNDSTYALLFADRLLAHLRRCGVRLGELIVQTDNGSEFGGANRRRSVPAFSRLVEQKWRCREHRFNPPRRSTYNSDVEAVHGIIEREFYELERFRGDVESFLNQAWAYQLYFNLVRGNSARRGLTPEQLTRLRAPDIDSKVFLLPPVLLSSLPAHQLPTPKQILAGHHVAGHYTPRREVWRAGPGWFHGPAPWRDAAPQAGAPGGCVL